MKLPGVSLAFLETLLNRLIQDQPGIVSDTLDNQCVLLHLEGLDTRLYLRFSKQTVFVFDEWSTEPDAIIRGTPVALASAGVSGRANTQDIKLEGDLQTAQAFERLLKQIDIDWEEHLSRFTGDVIAHQVGNLFRDVNQWGKDSANAFADDLRDYLQIEASHLPLPDEVDNFNNAVDDLHAAVERLEMRVRRLESRVNTESMA